MQKGDRVTWLRQMRGGYGYVVPVKAEVVNVGPSRVTIEVEKRA